MNNSGSARPGIRRGAPGWIAAVWLISLPLAAQEQEQAAGSSLPLSKAWNIASSGKAESSGQLLFRVTPGDGEDPVEVTVFVLSGSNETGVASSIRRALSTQLDARSYDIEAGQSANVLVTTEDSTGAGQASPGFSIELIDSDVENVRVMVQNAAPVAPPTVPQQNVPANPPDPSVPADAASPQAPGDVSPPANPQAPDSTPPPTPAPSAPNPSNTPDPSDNPAPATPAPNAPGPGPASPPDSSPPGAQGEAGASASAPPAQPAGPGG